MHRRGFDPHARCRPARPGASTCGRVTRTRATQLSRVHPDPAVQAAAAHMAARSLSHDADYRGMEALRASRFPELDVAIIGTWDNDQGKGFDTVRPPESTIDLDARYPGTVVEVGWRTGLPRTRKGTYDLDSLLNPSTWATAYATAVLQVPQAGPYELRMGTTSAFKIWLNGQRPPITVERASRVHSVVTPDITLPKGGLHEPAAYFVVVDAVREPIHKATHTIGGRIPTPLLEPQLHQWRQDRGVIGADGQGPLEVGDR